MKKTGFLLIASTAVAIAIFVGVPIAAAGDTECNGTLSGTIPGNVAVKSGAVCNLNAATVQGNVKVEASGRLTIFNNSTIHGDVESDGGHRVHIFTSTVNGSVQVKKAPPLSIAGDFHTIRDSTIEKDVQFEENAVRIEVVSTTPTPDVINGNLQALKNTSGGVEIAGQSIAGDVQAFTNTGGAVQVNGNTVGGNIQCKENTGVIGAGNSAGGNKEDQCATV